MSDHEFQTFCALAEMNENLSKLSETQRAMITDYKEKAKRDDAEIKRLRSLLDACPALSDDQVKQPCLEGTCGVEEMLT
jgi:hypothetical protein